MTQNKLKGLLSTTGQKPIQRGKPLELSTTVPTEHDQGDSAQSHERTIALSHNEEKEKRVNRGYKLKEDLIKQCKRLALDQNRKLYEVMEDALSEYLERHTSE